MLKLYIAIDPIPQYNPSPRPLVEYWIYSFWGPICASTYYYIYIDGYMSCIFRMVELLLNQDFGGSSYCYTNFWCLTFDFILERRDHSSCGLTLTWGVLAELRIPKRAVQPERECFELPKWKVQPELQQLQQLSRLQVGSLFWVWSYLLTGNWLAIHLGSLSMNYFGIVLRDHFKILFAVQWIDVWGTPLLEKMQGSWGTPFLGDWSSITKRLTPNPYWPSNLQLCSIVNFHIS